MRENGNDAVEIKQLLENGKYDLGIGYDFESDLNKDSIASLLQREISAGALDEVTTAEGINVVRMAVLIEAINEGRIDNLFDYAEVLRITDCALAPFCEKDYIIQNEKNITTRMKGEAIESFEEFYGQLIEKAVLSVVENPDGVGNIEEITTAFASEIGIHPPLASKVYQAVMGKSYWSYAELKEAMDNAEKSPSSQGSSSGGNSSSSSGGAAIVGGSGAQQAEPMEYDIFSDIGNVSWAKDAIVYLAQKGIVNGKEKNLFYPNDNIKREELAAILVAAFASDAPETEIYFNDVDKSSWYYSAVAKAAGADIIKGYSDDWFGSGENITRQDMVTMIYRAAVSSGIRLESAQISFSDENEIADYAKEAVGALTNSDIVNGMDFNTFSPTGFATRAQAAKIIYGLLML